MRHATVGAVDRLTDVASTVEGPLSVRRSQFDALAARLLTEPALTSVALARSAGGRAPARSGADDGPGPARPLQDRLRDLARRAHAEPRGRRAVRRARRRGGRDPLGRDARHPDPARGRRLAAEHRRRRAPSAPPAAGSVRRVPRDLLRRGGARARWPTHLPQGHALLGDPGRRARRAAARAKPRHIKLGDRVWTLALEQPAARQGLALATLLVGGLLTILIAVVGSQSLRRERDALGLIAIRRAERDRAELARRAAEERSQRARRDLDRPDLRARSVGRAALRLARLPGAARRGARRPAGTRLHRPRPSRRRRRRRRGAGRAETTTRSRSRTACAGPAGCRCGSRRACAWCATRSRGPWSRATRPCATSPSACSPRPRWPRPRSASAPPSRRRRSGWR